MEEITAEPPFPQVRPLPRGARGHVVAAKAALDALAAKDREPPFGWRQGIALALFAGTLGYGVVMGTLRWISVEKGADWIESAVPAACALLVAAATLWPRKRREPAEDAKTRGKAEAALTELGLAYLGEARSQAGTSQIVWAHNWQPLDIEDRDSFSA